MGERRPAVGASAGARMLRREAALQARWAAGEWRGQALRATSGEAYRVIYQGRPGGGAGPDFRDAVLLRLDDTDDAPTMPHLDEMDEMDVMDAQSHLDGLEPNRADGVDTAGDRHARRVYGDIELHLRPAGWRAHGHARDPRYNGLALHIVLDAGSGRVGDDDPLPATTLASGRRAPLIVLQSPEQPRRASGAPPTRWPCAALSMRLNAAERHALLLAAGMARFEQRAAHFTAELRAALITPAKAPQRLTLSNLWPNRRLASPLTTTPPHSPLPVGEGSGVGAPAQHASHPSSLVSPYDPPPVGEGRVGAASVDHILWLALAEALGYGRDRTALRAWGARLAAGWGHCDNRADQAPGALMAARADLPGLPRVERLRLRGLVDWQARWLASGPWAAIHTALTPDDTPSGATEQTRPPAGQSATHRTNQAAAQARRRLLAALRVGGGAVSPGRAVILAANVALPFAAAWATVIGDDALATQARSVYAALPGAPGNQITREMASQLGLPRAPAGAAAQQGLHHLWATHCREKRCDGCPCNPAGPDR